jgi:hypothetical protein
MIKTLFTSLFILFSNSSYANETLKCEFYIYQAPFITTESDLKKDRSLGESTMTQYLGAPPKSVLNKKIKLQKGELYSFELDEGSSESNLKVTIYKDLSGVIINPQSEISKEAEGECEFIVHPDSVLDI